MNISVAINKKYKLYTAVMLTSICLNNKGEHIEVYLLNIELEDKDIVEISEALKDYDIHINNINVKDEISKYDLPVREDWTLEVYLRLFLPSILPANVDRILYLDVDIIVNKSIVDFYNQDFEGTDMVVTHDSNGTTNRNSFKGHRAKMLAPAFDYGYNYFCSGVILFNIEKLRDICTFDYYMDIARQWEFKMVAFDQDILNSAHYNSLKYADWKNYNLFANLAFHAGVTYEQVRDSVAIIHFAGTKPWNTTGLHYPIEKLWWDYAKKTPHYQSLLEDFLNSTLIDSTAEEMLSYYIKRTNELEGKVAQLSAASARMMELVKRIK